MEKQEEKYLLSSEELRDIAQRTTIGALHPLGTTEREAGELKKVVGFEELERDLDSLRNYFKHLRNSLAEINKNIHEKEFDQTALETKLAFFSKISGGVTTTDMQKIDSTLREIKKELELLFDQKNSKISEIESITEMKEAIKRVLKIANNLLK